MTHDYKAAKHELECAYIGGQQAMWDWNLKYGPAALHALEIAIKSQEPTLQEQIKTQFKAANPKMYEDPQGAMD